MFQEPPAPNQFLEISEIVRTIATVATLLISITNLILTIILFKLKDNKEDVETDRKLRLEWFNKFILDYSLTHFHSFFENATKELEFLKTPDLTDAQKAAVIDKIKDLQKEFRYHFADSLLAVDEIMYHKLMGMSDNLVDGFTNAAFNEGIKLSYLPKFEEEITVKLSCGKTEMIKELFKFDGKMLSDKLQKAT